ncbi:MAG TPA: ChaN family lipoprotein [Chitinophagaceae bacterium]|nr:ChaN family lipoprotein [Chitinophagaceae bacterium]
MRFILLFLALSITAGVSAQDSMSMHYKIYDTRSKQVIGIDKIIADMANADVLFFGEDHNDSAGHYLENKIFRALHAAYGDKLALSMEMFEADNQLALDEYLQGKIDETRLGKDARLWNNYRDYRPMVEYAKQNKLPVIAANPPRRYVTLVTRRGMKALDSLSDAARSFLPPLPYDTLSGRYREKFMETMKGAPESASKNIYYSQSLWDAGMSYNINRFYKKNKYQKIFHCVGKFHVEEKLGTAAQLQKRNKKIKMLVISCFPDKSFSDPDWSKLEALGDYVILTNFDLKRTY